MDEPTDAEFEVRLHAAPPAAWAALQEALDNLDDGVHSMPKGGEKQADGSITMPWVELDDQAEALVDGLRGVGVVIPFDWSAWVHGREAMDLSRASAADVCRWVTAAIRADRFNEGTLASVIEEGRMSAAARRLLGWHENQQA